MGSGLAKIVEGLCKNTEVEEQVFRKTFNAFDKDKSGVLEKKEGVAFLSELVKAIQKNTTWQFRANYSLSEAILEKMWDRIVASGDSSTSISYHTFKEFLLSHCSDESLLELLADESGFVPRGVEVHFLSAFRAQGNGVVSPLAPDKPQGAMAMARQKVEKMDFLRSTSSSFSVKHAELDRMKKHWNALPTGLVHVIATNLRAGERCLAFWKEPEEHGVFPPRLKNTSVVKALLPQKRTKVRSFWCSLLLQLACPS